MVVGSRNAYRRSKRGPRWPRRQLRSTGRFFHADEGWLTGAALKAPAPVGLGHVKPPWRVNGFVNQTLRNEQEGVENAAMIRGSVSIRSVSAMPVVACALDPQDGSNSSSLTSTNASLPTSLQLHARKVTGSMSEESQSVGTDRGVSPVGRPRPWRQVGWPEQVGPRGGSR